MSSFWLDQSTDIRYTEGYPFTFGDIRYTAQVELERRRGRGPEFKPVRQPQLF